MNHITRWKRNTRLMWTVWSIAMIALLAFISNLAGLPDNADPMPLANGGLGCITDSECEGLVPSDNLSIIKGE